MENKNRILLASIAYLLYIAVGSMCMLIGSQMASLSIYFNNSIDKIALISSAFAVGRVLFSIPAGKLVEKGKPLNIVRVCCILILCYLIGISTINNYYLSLIFAALGGAAMAIEDVVNPYILSQAFPKKYSSALSATQIFYGIGTFTMSFLAGYMLQKNYYFGISNFLVAIFPIVVFILTLFASLNNKTGDDEEIIKPLYTKNFKFALIVGGSATLLYCLVCSTISLYTTSYTASVGFSENLSSNVLTFNNLGVIIGSILFCFILQKVQEKQVLLFNTITTLIFLFLSIYSTNYAIKCACMFIVGLVNGVDFSVILAIITRIGYEHIALASAIVAAFSGIGDILAPILLGIIFNRFGMSVAYNSSLIFLIMLTIAVIILFIIVKEEPYGNTK